MNIWALSSLFSSLICFLLANLVFYKNSKEKLNRIYALLAVLMSYLAFTEFMFRQSESYDAASFWLKMYSLWPFILVIVFYFLTVYIEKKQLFNNWLKYIFVYLPAVILFIAQLSDLAKYKIIKESWGYSQYLDNNLMVNWLIQIWILIVGLLVPLFLILPYYLKLKGKNKKQTKYVLMGLIVPVIIGIISGAVLPELRIRFPQLTSVYYLLQASFIGYAVWKHELFVLNPATAAENIISTMPGSLILLNSDLRISKVNRSLLNLLGYKEDELIGKPGSVIFEEKGEIEKEEILGKLSQEIYLYSIDTNLETKKGEKVPVLMSLSMIKDEEGQIAGIVIIARDITDRKKAEEALLIKNGAIESSINGIAIADMAGNLNYVNPAFLKLWGYGSSAEALGRTAVEFWQMGEKAAEIITALQSKGGWIGELTAKKKDGSSFDVQISASTVLDSTGKPVCMQAAFIDITERKKLEKALRSSGERFKTIFDNANDGIILADLQTKMFYTGNNTICQMLGYSLEELRNLGVNDIHPGADLSYVMEQFEKQARREIALAKDLPVKRKDGSVFYADVNTSVVTLDGKKYLMGIFRDTTGRKKAEEEKESLQKQLQQSEKMAVVGQLAGGVAHELNNPLTIVLGLAQLTMQDMEKTTQRYSDLKDIESATLRCKKIVSSLLTFSRSDNLDFKPVSIKEIIEGALSLYCHQVELNDIKIIKNYSSKLPKIYGDSQRLEQVFVNLILNAKDAMQKGGELTITTIIGKTEDGGPKTDNGGQSIEISIADTGEGIAKENMDKLFTPFFTTKPVGTGTGLGLPVCKGIVGKHGGRIEVQSEAWKGSVFTVILPVKTAEGADKQITDYADKKTQINKKEGINDEP